MAPDWPTEAVPPEEAAASSSDRSATAAFNASSLASTNTSPSFTMTCWASSPSTQDRISTLPPSTTSFVSP